MLEPREMIIDNNTKLKRITRNDLEREVSWEKFEEFKRSVVEQSTVVFEIEYECEDEDQIIDDVHRFLNIFRLYKVGNARSNSLAWQSSGTGFLGMDHDELSFFNQHYIGVAGYFKKSEINARSNSLAWQSSGTGFLGMDHDELSFFNQHYIGVAGYFKKGGWFRQQIETFLANTQAAYFIQI